MNQRLIKIGAGLAAAVVIALGGMAIARGSGDSAAANGNGFPGGPGAPKGYGFGGGFRGGPGDRDDVTGVTATKVTAAIKAKYPDATVRGIHQLPDGSFLALAINGNDFLPIHVSKDFRVLGTLQRPDRPGDPGNDHHGFGPGHGSMPYGTPPQGGWGAAPQGSQSSGATTSQQ